MQNNIVIRWALSAIIILVLVIGGYSVYASLAGNPTDNHTEHNSAKESSKHGIHEEHNGEMQTESEVDPMMVYTDGKIRIELKDKVGEPVDQLEVNHEKIMHLIIVSEDLKQYYHLHPEKIGKGQFQVTKKLSEGNYKAFIDIKPKNKEYMVKPLPIEVGTNRAHDKDATLKPETTFTKTIGDQTVTIRPETFKVKEPVTLSFSFNKGLPEPYLGALGHVVILDEKGNKYVHVHPVSEKETKFETQFDQPGVYKIWAEFKFNGKVHVYPYVVEVKS
ncbi:hypothetical protein SAMN04488137_1631 [Fictibacillus solisalsi]|uniref:YtkA-like n=1 Tax=Fictibacillus solisalsi TaxID=459525 RepID=A0A1G9VK25_9BACL|nr:hypothetical protein [Fictibacillus solisalsi]SDM72423.1 hypothetical protein SAMN04488137_1631 [Fictibacillus solisalsi]